MLEKHLEVRKRNPALIKVFKLNDVEKLRRSIYQTLQMRVRRNPDIEAEWHKAYFEK